MRQRITRCSVHSPGCSRTISVPIRFDRTFHKSIFYERKRWKEEKNPACPRGATVLILLHTVHFLRPSYKLRTNLVLPAIIIQQTPPVPKSDHLRRRDNNMFRKRAWHLLVFRIWLHCCFTITSPAYIVGWGPTSTVIRCCTPCLLDPNTRASQGPLYKL